MSAAGLARRTAVEIAFAGEDITASIRPYLLSVTYTDNEEDKTDDLQIRLEDRAGIWLEAWLQDAIEAASAEKLTIDAVLLRKNWKSNGGDLVLPFGEFELDTVAASGPPAVITIKATSLPFGSPIRQTKRNKTWKNIHLSGIVAEIAGKNGMTFMYESANDPLYTQVEQKDASDIAFLGKLCFDAGIALKTTSKIIVCYDQAEYEVKDGVYTIHRGGGYTKYKLNIGSADTQYSSCRVSCVDPASGKCIEGIAKIEDYNSKAKNNQQLEIKAKVKDKEEAKALAKKHLRQKNRYAKTAVFDLPGNPELAVGLTVILKGFGGFDGKYIITKAVHTVSGNGGYVTQITLCQVLEGY